MPSIFVTLKKFYFSKVIVVSKVIIQMFYILDGILKFVKIKIILFIILCIVLLVGCENNNNNVEKNIKENTLKDIQKEVVVDRESKIPADAVKITTVTDVNPPKSHSAEYNDPVPMPYPINTAGAEDSPFMLADGNTFYFFFTPDVRIPAEKQLLDGVTGIWVSKKVNNEWSKPERVVLQDSKKLALDGCEFVSGNNMLFCSAREGYSGIHWFSAELVNGKWQNWKNVDFNSNYKVGELHIFNDELYFHSEKTGGKGGLDIWMSKKINGEWTEPVNIESVNSANSEGWPALNPTGTELWFYKDYSIWRSKKINGEWTAPELMFSSLAGEPTIDNSGNVYFTHHFYKDNKMLEADIYVAKKK